ncbi:hypothetical protein AOLI_G00254850 [Acnodon oligacanthus]
MDGFIKLPFSLSRVGRPVKECRCALPAGGGQMRRLCFCPNLSQESPGTVLGQDLMFLLWWGTSRIDKAVTKGGCFRKWLQAVSAGLPLLIWLDRGCLVGKEAPVWWIFSGQHLALLSADGHRDDIDKASVLKMYRFYVFAPYQLLLRGRRGRFHGPLPLRGKPARKHKVISRRDPWCHACSTAAIMRSHKASPSGRPAGEIYSLIA